MKEVEDKIIEDVFCLFVFLEDVLEDVAEFRKSVYEVIKNRLFQTDTSSTLK